MVEYELRVSITDVVREQLGVFTKKYKNDAQAFTELKRLSGSTTENNNLSGILNHTSLQKTISASMYLVICPSDEPFDKVKENIETIESMSMPDLFRQYAERYYPNQPYDQARRQIAREIINAGITEKGIEVALDTEQERKKPIPLNVAIPLYMASRLELIGDYKEILESVRYRIVAKRRKEKNENDESDADIVKGFLQFADRNLAVLSMTRPDSDGTVPVRIEDYEGPTRVKDLPNVP